MSADPGSSSSLPRIGLLACSVFEREIAMLLAGSEHVRVSRWFEIGLHDRPEILRATLQASLTELETRDDIDAVVLAYGLCGRGTAGLHARRHPLVIARAHDCITHFLGSKEACAEHARLCPTCFYYTPGWNRAKRVPGPDRLEYLRREYATRFEPEDAVFLLETEQAQWSLYTTAAWVDLGTEDAPAGEAYARACARALGWRFQRLAGDAGLLRDLLWGRWSNDRFQVIPPGHEIAHAPDERIVAARHVARDGNAVSVR